MSFILAQSQRDAITATCQQHHVACLHASDPCSGLITALG